MEKTNRKSILKICVVCGDRANGYNFNAVSCESCKAFFRRNALRKKIFRCTFDNKCEISVVTRRFCQKCRLEKCFVKGMNKNLILSEDEKSLMKHRSETNKLKQQGIHCQNIHSMMKNSELVKCLVQTPTKRIVQDSNIQDESFITMFQNIQQENIYPDSTKLNYRLQVEEKIEKLIKSLKNEDNFNKMNINSLYNMDQPLHNELTVTEQTRIEELNRAFISEHDPGETTKECVQHSDILRLMERAVKSLIKMTNRIECFKSLCLLDQMALMKAACTQIIILRSIVRFNFDEQLWSYNKGQTRTTVIKLDFFKQSPDPTVYEAHKDFMTNLSEEWESDITIINLLSLIILFNPSSPDVIHKQLIAYEHKCHKYLLQRYLDTTYKSNKKSEEKFQRLGVLLKKLNYLKEERLRWHLEAQPHEIGPLLIEIFNLKN